MNRVFHFLVLLILLSSCSDNSLDHRLIAVYETAEYDPATAENILSNIDRNDLNEAGRHYYDVLRIRVDDKQERPLPYDSIVQEAIDYFSNYGAPDIYSTALYYGGRVAVTKGDVQKAHSYFLEALKQLPDNKNNIMRRGIYASQIATIFINLCNFKMANRYLSESIRIDSLLNDTANLARDLNQQIFIYNRLHQYDSAEMTFKKVFELSNDDKSDYIREAKIFSVWVNCATNKIDSALKIVKSIDLYEDSILKNTALCIAADAYLQAGFRDTAYMYLKQAIENVDPTNKTSAYSKLLSAELSDLIPKDSLKPYVIEYADLLKSDYDKNVSDSIHEHQSEYDSNERKNEYIKTEGDKEKTHMAVWIFIALILLIFIVLLILRIRHIRQERKLAEAGTTDDSNVSPDSKRATFRNKLLSLELDSKVCEDACKALADTPEYKELMELAEQKKALPPTKPLWDKLEKALSICCPDFFSDIETLAGRKMKKTDMVYIILVKYGLKQSEIATLTSNSQQTIRNTRKRVSTILFGEEQERDRFYLLIRAISIK